MKRKMMTKKKYSPKKRTRVSLTSKRKKKRVGSLKKNYEKMRRSIKKLKIEKINKTLYVIKGKDFPNDSCYKENMILSSIHNAARMLMYFESFISGENSLKRFKEEIKPWFESEIIKNVYSDTDVKEIFSKKDGFFISKKDLVPYVPGMRTDPKYLLEKLMKEMGYGDQKN